jgi:hypothetical protein
LKFKVNTGIGASLEFEGYQACVEAGLDLEKWATFGYDRDFKIKVMAWYRLSNLVSVHSQDAVLRIQEARAKKAKRKKR